jgi:hypothetical protein
MRGHVPCQSTHKKAAPKPTHRTGVTRARPVNATVRGLWRGPESHHGGALTDIPLLGECAKEKTQEEKERARSNACPVLPRCGPCGEASRRAVFRKSGPTVR